MAESDSPVAAPLTLFIAMVISMLAVGVPLGLLTAWPPWVYGAVAGGVGGLAGPLVTRWIVARQAHRQEDR